MTLALRLHFVRKKTVEAEMKEWEKRIKESQHYIYIKLEAERLFPMITCPRSTISWVPTKFGDCFLNIIHLHVNKLKL